MVPLDLLSRNSELALGTLSNGPGFLNSPLWVCLFAFVFLFMYFNAKIFKGEMRLLFAFPLLLLLCFNFSLQLSLFLQATGPVSIIVLVTVALSHVVDYWNSGGERCSSV